MMTLLGLRVFHLVSQGSSKNREVPLRLLGLDGALPSCVGWNGQRAGWGGAPWTVSVEVSCAWEVCARRREACTCSAHCSCPVCSLLRVSLPPPIHMTGPGVTSRYLVTKRMMVPFKEYK